jgi:hypothetical protein
VLQALLPPPRPAPVRAAHPHLPAGVHLPLSRAAEDAPAWLAAVLALGLTVLLAWALEPRLFARRRRLS